jgi:hypothetical protein
MPIRPKHVLGRSAPLSPRPFVGRAEFVAQFEQALALPGPGTKPTLVFYGAGGIGKTRLRRRLAELIESRADAVSAVLDFDTPNYRSAETALFLLRRVLGERHKVKFPTFDIAYTVYWQKAHPGADLNKEEPWFLEAGDRVAEIAGQLGAVSLVGLIPKLALTVARGGRYLQEWWQRRGSRELSELPELDLREIRDRLATFWSVDLQDHLVQRSASGVIFVDSYQELWGDATTDANLAERDLWVRRWMALLPQVLWVVCGRDRLRWTEFEPEWQGRLNQHLLPGLPDADAVQLLDSCGITDPAVREAIVEGSLGVPYYLQLAVETCESIRNRESREPTVADFADTPREIFARFVGHLPRNEIEALKVLAGPRYWDAALAERLMIEFRTGFSISALQELPQMPFVGRGPLPGTWTLNRLVRSSLTDRTPPEFRLRLHRYLFDLHSRQLEGFRQSTACGDPWQVLTDAFYHAQQALSSTDFVTWVLTATEPFADGPTRMFLVPLYQQVIGVVEARPGDPPPAMPELHRRLSELMGGSEVSR